MIVCSSVWFAGLHATSAMAATGPVTAAGDRPRWTTSRIVGSPEPPLPYAVEPFLPDVAWSRPLYVAAEPGTDNLFVIEQGGEPDRPARVLRVPDREDARQATPLLAVDRRLIYGVAFHPDYIRNGRLYVFSNGPTGARERQNRISCFTVARTAPFACDASTEQIVLQWRSMGHDGGDLCFDKEGLLYIASGDGTSDSDGWVTGQDVTDLLGGVLRIDVDRSQDGRPYRIPTDNPFLEVSGARGELYAFGLRNPWRMTYDRRSDQLWVGNNGQDLWETAHLVRAGDNYGWSVYEGSHPFYAQRPLGPTPVVRPTIEHHHREARSLTGGVVYRGEALPELEGAYVYGDYSTGKIWGARHDGQELVWHRELADTALQIVGFAISTRQQLIIVDHGSGLYRLVPRPESEPPPEFPRRLSATGLFRDVADHAVAPGVLSYRINAPAWHDGADAERYVALPGEARIGFTDNRGWDFPNGTVLMQTLSLPDAEDGRARRIETRLLTRQQGEWAGYTYRWNAEQDDAVLVESVGADGELAWPSADPDAKPQRWRFPSRAECLSCHSRAMNYVLGLTRVQMQRDISFAEGVQDQIATWQTWGLFDGDAKLAPQRTSPLVNPYDTSQALEARVRSYLHTNCAGCHVEAGGGNARMELEITTKLDKTHLLDAYPQHDSFGLAQPRLVQPGEPEQSVLWLRMSRRGRGQMPPLVSQRVDAQAVDLFAAWIRQLPRAETIVRPWTYEELLPQLDELLRDGDAERGQMVFQQLQCGQCHRLGDAGGGAGPILTQVGQRLTPAEVLLSLIEPSRQIAAEFASMVIVTKDGQRFEGRIERETDTHITLRPANAFEESRVIPVADIEDRHVSTRSTMPSGLLNTLSAARIGDLLRYVTGTAD